MGTNPSQLDARFLECEGVELIEVRGSLDGSEDRDKGRLSLVCVELRCKRFNCSSESAERATIGGSPNGRYQGDKSCSGLVRYDPWRKRLDDPCEGVQLIAIGCLVDGRKDGG